MYDYVKDKEYLKRAKRLCSEILSALEDELRLNGVNTQFFLIGSGARNMVTQNGDGAIDFDYNLNTLSYDKNYNERELKELVRKIFNKILKSYGLYDCEDSTSSLTTKKIYFIDSSDIEFSIDLCIVRQINGSWQRLIHRKTGNTYFDQYYWNDTPNSRNYYDKSRRIKAVPGWWEAVRDEYLDIKNGYLRRNDNNHPSFVCYIEAVNNVYNTMRHKHLL